MENFIPKQPKIKYIIPKVIPTSFSLNGESKEEIDIEENNKFNFDRDSELECDDLDLNNYNEKGLDDLNQNSIYFTLLKLKKRSESTSSMETKDSL